MDKLPLSFKHTYFYLYIYGYDSYNYFHYHLPSLCQSLAVADILFIVFCVPFTATDYILPSWPFGEVWCKMVQYLTYVTAYASVFTLLLLSIDRYLAVVHAIAAISSELG